MEKVTEDQSKMLNIDKLNAILAITETINRLKDLDSVLARILHEARNFTHADAGTIFMVDGKELHFSYSQNDTLKSKEAYKTFSIPLNDKSISGYVALSGESLMINDVYEIPEKEPYSFNTSFDKVLKYRTKSMLVVPLKTSRDTVVGVLQIINAKDPGGEIVSFDEKDKFYVSYFANNSAVAIERADMTRELILRMLKMSELRDPKETGAHVNRVGAYTAEIYEQWATKNGISAEIIRSRKDLVRIAAMMHDVGKVAITDAILKKPAKLNDEEFNIMKYHTIFGAQLFKNSRSEMDQLSADIAISHHERWDGKGYPGRIDDIFAEDVKLGSVGYKGEEIPIEGRIVALADVYDALISKRVYKDAWDEDEVVSYIKEMGGSHFDPGVVEAFIDIYDTIKAIREKYQEGSS